MDMHWADEAIFHERLPIPTVDELLEELDGLFKAGPSLGISPDRVTRRSEGHYYFYYP